MAERARSGLPNGPGVGAASAASPTRAKIARTVCRGSRRRFRIQPVRVIVGTGAPDFPADHRFVCLAADPRSMTHSSTSCNALAGVPGAPKIPHHQPIIRFTSTLSGRVRPIARDNPQQSGGAHTMRERQATPQVVSRHVPRVADRRKSCCCFSGYRSGQPARKT